MTKIRSFLFLVLCALLLIPYSIVVSLCCILPHKTRFAIGNSYARTMNWLLKFFCNIGVEIEGANLLPNEPSVILIKHSSPWETLALFQVFPPGVIVLKRELMWIPLFGWALASLKAIAINRKAGHNAITQILEQGKVRLEEGMWVLIFPEGTRVPRGQLGRFGIGGALLACDAQVPVVPIAHNAGDHWPSGKLEKTPGVITLRIGRQIATKGKTPEQVITESRVWMEQAMKEISPSHRHEPGEEPLTSS